MRLHNVLAAAALACALATPPGAQTLPKGVTKGPAVEGIAEYRLENGLKVLLFPDASKPTVTVNVTFMVGSKHENYGETGMAHLLEHLVFKGTAKRGNIMKELESRGAQFNGTTSLDRTNYYETLTASDENLRWALEMEADRMVNSRIAKSDLDTEMTVVRNEWEMGQSNPISVTIERTMAAAYDWHNYGKTTIGARSDIENVPIDRLQAFYRHHYQPDNAMLVIAGKFDEPKALALVAELFGPIPKPSRKLQKLYTRELAQDGERTVTVRRSGDTQLLVGAYHLPPGTHEDFAAATVLMSVLGDTPSGRLYKAMVDNKKASDVFGGGMQQGEPGLMLIGARLTREQNLNEARELLFKVVETLAAEPPTKEEVERARTKILKGIELSLANSAGVGVELSEWESMADWRMIFVNRDRIRKVAAEDVVRVARAYLKESNRTLGIFIPTAKPDRSEIPEAPDVAAILRDYKGSEAMAQGEAFDPSFSNIEARTRRRTLANGMKLVLLPRATRGSVVSAAIELRYGNLESMKGNITIGQLTGQMLNRGTAKRSRQQIDDEFSKLNAEAGFDGGPGIASAHIRTVRKSLVDTIKLAAEVLREPSFPEQELEPVRQAFLAGIEQERSDPIQIASTEMRRSLESYPRGDPRATRTPDEEVADAKAVTLAQIRQFHKDFYGASNAILSVAGDFDEAEIAALAESLFGSWKSTRPYTRIIKEHTKAPVFNRTLDTPDKANAMFLAGTTLDFSDEHPDFPAMALGNYIVGGSANSRLINRLRQKEGFSYGAGSQLDAPAKSNSGGFYAYAILAPENLVKLEAAFRDEMTKILGEGLSAEEIASAKKSWKQERELGRSEDGSLRDMLAKNEFFGRTMKRQQETEAKVEALTAEQVNTALRRHLRVDGLAIVKAGDVKKAGVKAN